MEFDTSYGKVSVERLVHCYEVYKAQEEKKMEKKRAYLQTEEGKQWNRAHSKAYYEKNKETIKAKAKARYAPKKVKKEQELPVEPIPLC